MFPPLLQHSQLKFEALSPSALAHNNVELLFSLFLRIQSRPSAIVIPRMNNTCRKNVRTVFVSNKLLEQGYVKERLKSSLRKFYGRYGDHIKQYQLSLSQMLNDILWPDHIQWQPPTDQTLYRNPPFTELWVVSIALLRRVWHADRGRLLLRTPSPVPLGLAYVLLVETNPFPNLSLFYRTMLFEYPSVLSRFCFVSNTKTYHVISNYST